MGTAHGCCPLHESRRTDPGDWRDGLSGHASWSVSCSARPHARLALLIRPRPGQTPAQRAESILSEPADSSRVQVYARRRDASPTAVWTLRHWQHLSAEVTRVIHCAATVRFDHSLEEARHMNVDGTRKMLDFAASMRSLKSFVYVGTAYVAGEREGLIREDELDVGQHFRNTYEQTKAEAEALVRSRHGLTSLRNSASKHHRGRFADRASLPASKCCTGRSRSTREGYGALCRDFPMPCSILCLSIMWPRAVVSARVRRKRFGRHRSLVRRATRQRHDRARRKARCGVLQSSRAALCRSQNLLRCGRPLLSLVLWGRKRRVLVDGAAYRDYFTMRMQFDTTNAERLLGPAGICPAAGDGLSRPPASLLRGQRLGPQGSSGTMSLLRRIQLARDRSITVANLVDELLRRKGDSEVSVSARRELSIFPICTRQFAEIDAFLRRSIGLRPAEPVAIYCTNDHHCFHWFLAIIRAGGIAVPLNPQLSLSEVQAHPCRQRHSDSGHRQSGF